MLSDSVGGSPRPVRWVSIGLVALCVAAGVSSRAIAHGLHASEQEAPAASQSTATTPATERMKSDVTYLASDERDGRAPGTKGIEAAAEYIAGVFKEAGLKPAPGAKGFFQPFLIAGKPDLKSEQTLAFIGPSGDGIKAQRRELNPLAIGTGGVLEKAPIVFAGYGITALNDPRYPKLAYDDYAGLDVRGKIVLVLRNEPRRKDEASPFDGAKDSRYATFEQKAVNAFGHGALAVLLVNSLSALNGQDDTLLGFMAAGPEPYSNVPFVMLSRAVADKLLAAAGEPSLSTLEAQIDEDLKPRSRELKGWSATANIAIGGDRIETKNVVGVLEGAGPHSSETIVIGGHYDHLGHGGALSGSLAFFSSDIHNGADDNASGTAMVLELARRLGARRDPPPRRIVFMAFSGEEKGLLGSHYYVNHPLFSLEDTVMMINCDMVGRLNAKNELTMIGTGTSPGMDQVASALGRTAGLNIKSAAGLADGFGGSDHESFYNKGIPVIFAFTGLHGDYHRPSDDSNLINYPGMARIADYLELIALDVIRRPERPSFTKLAQARANPHAASGGDPARAGSSVSTGTMPDYSYEGKDGLKIAGVRPGGPAEKGGIKEGDLIVRFNGRPVGTIYDYMDCLKQSSPGQAVEIVVKRDEKEVKLMVTLELRP
jgi:Peptidase family M28/PDZ domain/PA domain